jgi:hypothetical protein
MRVRVEAAKCNSGDYLAMWLMGLGILIGTYLAVAL